MKTVLVTGDSSGIGLASVRRLLASTNYRVVGIARSSPQELVELGQNYPGRYIHVPFDLSDLAKLEREMPARLTAAADRYIGFLDNAGTVIHSLVTGLKQSDIERVMRTNFQAPALMCRIMVRHFIAKRVQGSIVHISSVAAQTGFRGLSAYAASKGALEAFSRTIATEWGSRGIRSNVLSLGLLNIGISRTISADFSDHIRQLSPTKSTAIP